MAARAEPQHLDEIFNRYQGLLVALKLAAYATDAMRVLRALETNAEISPSLEQAIRSACPDWRNPGSIYDPAELISTGLMHVVEATQSLFNELAQA